MNGPKLWAADPTSWGPGKVHIINVDDVTRTHCGKLLSAFPGRATEATSATCKTCINVSAALPARRERQAQYEAERNAREQDRVEQNAKWWAWYDEYLRSPEWRAVRQQVIARAGGKCEGCGMAEAAQAHHKTYEHVGAEFLWELVAVCERCHDRLHESRRKDQVVR